jgi:hypothetical protein
MDARRRAEAGAPRQPELAQLPGRLRPMHPFVRSLVIAAVGLIVAGGLLALALLTRDSNLSQFAVLGAGLVGTGLGGYLFVRGWIWSQRSWRAGLSGRAVGIAIAGGLGVVLAGVAAAGVVVLVLTFYAG